MKILMFSTHSMKYIWYSLQKSKYPLYIGLSMRLYTMKLYSAIMAVFRRFEILKDYLRESTSLSQTYRHDLDVREELQSQNKN